MKNEEFIELRNKFLLGVLVALVVTVPFLLFFVNRYLGSRSSIMEAYNNKKTFTVLVYKSSDCNYCSIIKSRLKGLDIYYLEYDIDKPKDKERTFKKFGFSEKSIVVPALIYVKDGESVVRTFDIKDEAMIDEFIKYSKTA